MTDTFDKGNAAFIAKRYASERRFKAYGAVALAVSVLFLVYLIVDIGIKAWPSFFEHRAVLEVNLDASKIPATDVLKGDFEGLVKDGFRSLFPGVTTRGDVRSLTSLLSAGAADDLRQQTAANPVMIGTTVRAGALLADDADLYLKGMLTTTRQDARNNQPAIGADRRRVHSYGRSFATGCRADCAGQWRGAPHCKP